MVQLTEWFAQNVQNCLFIVGMGGIGKSTLMHSFIARNTKEFDTVIYVDYNMSIVRTIIDDIKIRINTIEQDEYESSNEYFKRKLEVIRELAIGKNIVLIIDHYTGEQVQDISAILDINWKIVLITRNKSLTEGYKVLEIGAIQNNETLYSLFENYLGRHLSKNEYPYLDNIIKKVAGHTLILKLIAKQVSKSYISLAETSDRVEKLGFSNIASEKVDYMKDSVTYHETIKNIIHDLFITPLSDIKRTLIKISSLFGIYGIDINILSDMLRLNSKDDFNELISESLISMEDKHISVHPVIIETMHQEEWTEDSKEKAVQVMDYLFVQIKFEGKREEYPKKELEKMQFYKELCEHNERLNKHSQRSIQECISTKGVIGEIFSKRFEQCNVEKTTDHRKLNIYLQISESFLKECKRENPLLISDNYKSLMYQTIINMPREREDFILCMSEELVNDPSFRDKKNVRILLDLCSIIIRFYEENGNFLAAKNILDELKTKFKYHNNFVLGEYYYLLASYYNARLTGYYDGETCEKEKLIKLFIHNINKAIQYMSKARDLDSEMHLGKYYCFKALVLIEKDIGNPNEIKKLLNTTKQLIEKYVQAQSKLVRDYNMTCARYYTYIECDFEKVVDYISEAYGITFNVSQTDFDTIDEIIIIIKIFSEWQIDAIVIKLLKFAIELCNNHKNELVYLKKEIELLIEWFYISYKKQDFEMCKVIMKGIEEDAPIVGVNMEQIVPVSIQKEIYSK